MDIEKRHFGVIRATIDNQAKRVVMTHRKGPGWLPDSQMVKLAAWALDGVRDLRKAGYFIDASGLAEFMPSTELISGFIAFKMGGMMEDLRKRETRALCWFFRLARIY